MTDLVPAEDIERIVGVDRHPTDHYGRVVTAEQTLYILHSRQCCDSGRDLRECGFSVALDRGIELESWREYLDLPVQLGISCSDSGDDRLVPVAGTEAR